MSDVKCPVLMQKRAAALPFQQKWHLQIELHIKNNQFKETTNA
jgi:hypothetical protein